VSGSNKEQLDNPAWSPDGRVIVCYILQPQGALTGLEIVDAYSGQRKALVRSENGVVLHPEWLPDGSELLALYRDASSNFTRNQVIHVSFPGGTLTPVTRDASNYTAISVARRGPIAGSGGQRGTLECRTYVLGWGSDCRQGAWQGQ